MANRILAVDDNAINLKLVQTALSVVGFEVFTASSGIEALAQLEKVHPELVVLDIDMPEMDGYEVCKRIRSNPATLSIPVVMLTAHDTLEEKVKGFEVGADEYIVKPFQPAELQVRIKAIIRRQETSKASIKKMEASTIAVFSLRGGAGVSTVSTNLAFGLSQIWNAPVALVDMALYNGQCALMCNLSPKNSWSDLTRSPVDELDPEMIQSAMLAHESGLHVLACPRRVEESELITAELVSKVLIEMKNQYQYIVLDLSHDFTPVTLAALDSADEILAIMAPELASVRAMNSALEIFGTLDYEPKKTHLGMNWVFEKRGLASKEIEKVLKKQIEFTIPFAPENFVMAINFGKPPVWHEPTSPLGALFEDLAYTFSKEEDRKSSPKQPSPALMRVRARESARQKK